MWVSECSSTWEREGWRCKSRAWNELGVSMVCCLERAACGGVTELWRNQGNEIFLRAFFTIVAGFPAGDVMTVLPRVQFTCTKYPTIIVCGMRNGMIEDVIKRTSGMLSFFFFLFFFLVINLFPNRSESLVHHRFVTLTIERIHSTQVSRPYWSRYLSFLVSFLRPPLCLTLSAIPPYYVFLTLSQPPYPLTFLPSLPSLACARARARVCICMRLAIALARISIILEPHPTIFSRYSLASRRYRYPTTKHRTNQGKNRS